MHQWSGLTDWKGYRIVGETHASVGYKGYFALQFSAIKLSGPVDEIVHIIRIYRSGTGKPICQRLLCGPIHESLMLSILSHYVDNLEVSGAPVEEGGA